MAYHYSQEEIDKMTPEARSEAWHSADKESQAALHEANNRDLSGTHDYDSGSGTWSSKETGEQYEGPSYRDDDYSRRTDQADTIQLHGNTMVYYDENGYAVKGVNMDSRLHLANKGYGNSPETGEANAAPGVVNGGGGGVGGGGAPGSAPANDMLAALQSWLSAAQGQQTAAIDYATQQGEKEIRRAEEDAQKQFQTQRNQISADEQKALDNQALYAEARGDRGGIGQAQYASIQNNAAKNRVVVSQAQTKLSTDTARQISDLRAQGEFEKADALLELTQQYLSQLMSLEQWAAAYNLDVARFQESIRQWNAEFEMGVADLTGVYRGQQTLAAQKALKSSLASTGELLLQSGIMPSPDQIAAMDMTQDQARQLLTSYQLAAAAKVKGSGDGGGGDSTYSSGTTNTEALYQELLRNGIYTEAGVMSFLLNDRGVKESDRQTTTDAYLEWLENEHYLDGTGAELDTKHIKGDGKAEDFRTLYSWISTYLQRGNKAMAAQLIDKYGPGLTDDQVAALNAMLRNY